MSPTHSTFERATTGDEVVSAFADRVKGRVFVVTGPSPTGIGASTLTSLAKAHPAVLVLAGRTPSKFQSVVDGDSLRSLESAQTWPTMQVS